MINRIRENFTQVNNSVLDCKELSLKSKWLYAFLCSKPDTWNFSYNWLSSQLQEWEKAIRTAIKELVDIWVLLRYAKKVDGKFAGWDWIINPTDEDLSKYIDPTKNGKNRTYLKQELPEIGTSQNGNQISNMVLNNTVLKKESSLAEKKQDTTPPVNDKNIIDQDTNKTLSVNDKNIIDQNLLSTTTVNVYKYYVDAFPKKKGHAKKLWITRITELLKSNTEEDLKRAVDNYKKDKLDTIKKQEWTFVKTAENFFWYEKWTKIRFIERYLQEEEVKPKKELPKSNDWMWWLEEDTYNLT